MRYNPFGVFFKTERIPNNEKGFKQVNPELGKLVADLYHELTEYSISLGDEKNTKDRRQEISEITHNLIDEIDCGPNYCKNEARDILNQSGFPEKIYKSAQRILDYQ